MSGHQRASNSAGYELFMLTLCVYAIAALTIESVVPIKPEILDVLEYADIAVCAFFFLDFLLSLWWAQDRWAYLRTWGWLDLLSSIPMLDMARWGRLARIVRIFRVLRALRATKILAEVVVARRTQNTLLTATLVVLLLMTFCSAAVLQFETDPESNIKTGEDAIWWAFATITTVGYGDYFPVTSEGRFIAAILMFAGVGLFGTFSAVLAAWFLASEEDEGQAALAGLKSEIAALRNVIEQLHPPERPTSQI